VVLLYRPNGSCLLIAGAAAGGAVPVQHDLTTVELKGAVEVLLEGAKSAIRRVFVAGRLVRERPIGAWLPTGGFRNGDADLRPGDARPRRPSVRTAPAERARRRVDRHGLAGRAAET